jgi:hypothetical protein
MLTGSEEAFASKCLQEAADALFADIPDRFFVEVDDDSIRWKIETWSISLARQTFEDEFSIEFAEDLVLPGPEGLDWRADALQIVKGALGGHSDLVKQRHAAAQMLGLMRIDGYEDLPSHRFMIDRELLAMLDAAGCDVRRAGARINGECPASLPTYWFDDIQIDHGDRQYFIRLDGVATPVIWAFKSIGNCTYSGNSLGVPIKIPETASAAAVGRRLGEIAQTGIPSIDRRPIRSVGSLEMWGGRIETIFRFDPDLVQLGPPDPASEGDY